MKLSNVLCGVAALGALSIFLPSDAQAQEACAPYTVQQGDSLAAIAQAAYGTRDYQIIFNANRDVIIGNPNNLEAGIVLNLPCADGRLTATSEFNEVVRREQERAQSNAPRNVYEPPLRLLAGNDWAPYTDESLTGGGVLMRLTATALHRAGNSREYNSGWVNDFNSHLYTLLPAGAYDIAVAWVVPDCSKNPDVMGEDSLYRCNGFYASQPLYESVVGYYTLPDSKYANAQSIEELEGAVFCRMEGFFTNDLEEAGLVAPKIELLRPRTPEECIEAVMNGTAHATGMAIQQANGAIAKLGLENEVVQNENITHLSTIRLLAHKSNPFGLQYISMLNNGLNEMRQSGEWYDIVSSSLAEYTTQSQAASN